MFFGDFSAMTVYEKASSIAFYVSLVVFAGLIAAGIMIRKKRPDRLSQFFFAATGVVIGYSVSTVSTLAFLKFDEFNSAGYIDLATFIPVAALLLLVATLVGIGVYYAFRRPMFLREYARRSALIAGIALVAFVIYRVVLHYVRADGIDFANEALLYIFTALLTAAIVAMTIIFGKKTQTQSFGAGASRPIVFAAISIALSYALSYVSFLQLPLGGRITLASLLPLMIYSYLFGSRRGVFAGAVYGLLMFVQEPFFYHPVQFMLDYPIAFSAIGLAGLICETGLLRNRTVIPFILGAALAITLRYLAHVVSGIFVFGSGDPENFTAVGWSFFYNSFVFADGAVSVTVGSLLLTSRTFRNFIGMGDPYGYV